MEPCDHDSLQLRQLPLRWVAGIRREMWLFFWAALAPLMIHEASINTCWLIAYAEDTLFLRCSPSRGIRAALSSSYDVVPPRLYGWSSVLQCAMFEQSEIPLALLLCSVRVCAHILVTMCGRAAVCLPLAACSLSLPVLSVSVSICLRVYTVLA